MKTTLPAALALTTLLSLAPPAGAQGVWRCGAEGRSYSDLPCSDGRQLAPAEARPLADIQSAHQQAARERQTADALRSERLAQESVSRGNGLGAIGPQADRLKPSGRYRERPLAAPRQAPRQRLRHEDDGTWRAVAPPSRRKQG